MYEPKCLYFKHLYITLNLFRWQNVSFMVTGIRSVPYVYIYMYVLSRVK
jgi:hypothetical protein